MCSNLLTPGATNYSWDITSSAALLPSYIILFFVSNNNGTYNSNPFNFLNLGINNIYLVTNNQTHPRIAYNPDFGNQLISREYLDLLNLNDRDFTDSGTSISKEMFCSGTALFAFKFSGYKSDAYSLAKTGSIRAHINLTNRFLQAVNAIAYMCFDDFISLDQFNNVQLNAM